MPASPASSSPESAHAAKCVADYLVRALAQAGVSHFFGVSGANIEAVFDAVERCPAGDSHPKPTRVLAKHEFSAVTMADGYSRATGRLGVVMSTSGGGAMNLLSGLAEAYASRVPVLAIVGQVPSDLEGRGGFQDSSGLADSLDARAIFSAVSRHCIRVTAAAEVPQALHDAVQRAMSAPRGPAVVLIPKDVQEQVLPAGLALPALPVTRVKTLCDYSHGDRRRIAGILTRAALRRERVVIVAGADVGRDGARGHLARLVELLEARVVVTPEAKDAFDNHHSAYRGVVGIMGHQEAHAAVADCSVILLVGTRLPLMARAGLSLPDPTVPRLAIAGEEPFAFGDKPWLNVLGNVADELCGLIRALPERDGATPTTPASPLTPLPSATLPGSGPLSPRYQDVVAALETAMAPGTQVFADAGNAGASVVHFMRVPRDGSFVVALGMGGMGYSFGAAIGAALATGRQTWVIAGDGAFFMHGMEVHTALEYDAPVTFVVLNNNAHAMCFARERLYFTGGDDCFNVFQPAELSAGMAAMLPGLQVMTPEQLQDAAAPSGPRFVSVTLDPAEIPPFRPFLDALGPRPACATPNTRGGSDDDHQTQRRTG